LARGEVVWIAESDDLWRSRFPLTLVPVMANPAIMLAFAKTPLLPGNHRKVVFTSKSNLHDLVDLRFDVEWVRSAKDLVLAGFYDRNLVRCERRVAPPPGEMRFSRRELAGHAAGGDWLFYLD